MNTCADPMYRILAERLEVRERRRQCRHPHYSILATGPNQCWLGHHQAEGARRYYYLSISLPWRIAAIAH